MKRVGYLFERVIDPENLRLAFVKASRGKRHREDQRLWQENLEEEIVRLRKGLVDLDYSIGNYRRFTIYEPKEREICADMMTFGWLGNRYFYNENSWGITPWFFTHDWFK